MAAMLTGCGIFGGSSGQKSKYKEAELPGDRQGIVAPDNRTYTPEEIKRGVVKGDWSILQVYDKEAVGESAPFLKFAPSQKRMYGNNGCNTINASYVCVPSDSVMQFKNVISTMMACATPGITDTDINRALAETRHYSWRVDGSDYYISFYNNRHECVMTLMHQNFDFLNGTWLVTAINDEKINVPDMKLVIDVDEGKLHGNTGCNILNGRMDINMDTPNSISFSAISATQAACAEPNHETQLLVALEEAVAARPVTAYEVILYDNAGKQVLNLKRTSDK